jgi:hypothetical protein
MAGKNLFQIEPTRKVAIVIPGYDPLSETQKIDKRSKSIWDRDKRRRDLALQQEADQKKAALEAQEMALAELNKKLQPKKTVKFRIKTVDIGGGDLFP